MKLTATYAFVAMLVLAGSTAQLRAANFEFITIAEGFSTIDGVAIGSVFSPAMNNNREVVFKGSLCLSPLPQCSPTFGAAIFTPDALLVRQGATIDGITLDSGTSLGRASINDSGLIVFSGSWFVTSAATLRHIYLGPTPVTSTIFHQRYNRKSSSRPGNK